MFKPSMTQSAWIVGLSALVGYTTVDYIETMKTERQKRKQIKLDTEKQIAEIHYARDMVIDKINNGEYDNKMLNIPTILSDFEFYRLAHRFEE